MLLRLSKLFLVCLLLLTITCACQKKESYSREDFINDVASNIGLDTDEPVQRSIDFGLIDESDELDKALDLRFLVYVLTNYLSLPETYRYEEEGYLSKAYEWKLINEGDSLRKHVEQEKALVYIDKANTLKESLEDSHLHYVLKPGRTKLNENEPLSDQLEQIDLTDEFIVDFKEVEVKELFPFEDIQKQEDQRYEKLSSDIYQRSFKLKDYEISYRLYTGGIGIRVVNEKLPGNFYAEAEIYDVKPKVKLKADKDSDYTYLKVDFRTSEAMGFNKTFEDERVADLNEMKNEEGISRLLSMFKKEEEVAEQSIELLEISTPLPSFNLVKLTLSVKLNFYASGKIAITFDTANKVGFERNKDGIRYINDFDKNVDFLIKAESDLTTSVSIGLKSMDKMLADIENEIGIHGEIPTTIHVYDDEGKRSRIISSDLPADYLDANLAGGNLKLCTDLSVYWLWNVTVNSKGTLLNDFNATTSFNVLKDDYQLIEGPIHLENFVRVDHCTRQDQLINEIEQVVVDPNRLILELYHKALSKGETYMIKVKGLPEGYSIGDLIYYSSDPNIATVDDKGTIKAVSTGATEINVKTKDEKYLISMTVLVKSE